MVRAGGRILIPPSLSFFAKATKEPATADRLRHREKSKIIQPQIAQITQIHLTAECAESAEEAGFTDFLLVAEDSEVFRSA